MSTHDLSPGAEPGAAQAETAETAIPASPDELMAAATARIAELEAALLEMKDRWMRAEAENQNVRNRAKREVDDARQYAVQGFARDVAEAAENLKRGIDSMPAAGGPPSQHNDIIERLREGFVGVERSFIGLLERNGIKREDPTGAVFDPNLHQAMAEQESTDHPPGTVMQAWSQSWTLHGRLLRPAMVVVAKAPASPLPGGNLNTTA